MADSRDKMMAAIEAKKKAPRPAAPAKKPAAKAPAKKAPAKKAPEPVRRPESSRPAAEEKPAAPKKSFFKKSKKKAPTAEKPKKPAAKKKESGPKGESVFGRFAKHMVDEFKNATDEIKPKALIATAADSIKSIKSMVNRGEGDEGLDRKASESRDNDADFDSDRPEARTPTAGLSSEVRQEDVFEAHGTQGSDGESAPAEFSAAKVQRAPKKKPKEEPAEDAPAEFSAAKVQRAPKKKIKEEDQDEAISIEFEAPEEEMNDSGASDQENAADSENLEVDELETEPSAEQEYEDLAEEPEAAAEAKSEPTAEPVANGEPKAETRKSSKKSKTSGEERAPSKVVHKHAQAAVRMSKKDQAIRSFEALQTVLKNPLWKSVIVDPDVKPSSLYSPREKFDENFADETFRAGLKAANRLAASFSFDPDSINFNENVIERVVAFQVDPKGVVKRDTDSPTKLIDEEHLKKLFGMIKDPQVRGLFYSAGTRLGEFVPTIEILARIYLAMRKKADVNPGERLSIQEEVLIRYKKSQYTDSKGKKARALALNYFTDFLAEYGMRIYKDRFESAPEGTDNIEGQLRRHKVIKSHCFHLFESRGTKIGLSQPAMINLKAHFSETADNYLKSVVADIPDDVFEEMNDY